LVDLNLSCNILFLDNHLIIFDTMSSPTSITRPGATAYIDEEISEPLDNVHLDAQSASGSSVEEESDEDEFPEPAVGGEVQEPKQRLEDFAYLDQRRQASGSDEVSDESEWDVDDEDWELANGGTSPVSL
jgi:hypothetical protein